MGQLRRLDAVMYHAFELYAISVLRHSLSRTPLLVWSADNPPKTDPVVIRRMVAGACVRTGAPGCIFALISAWRTALFFPFSQWAAQTLVQECGVPAEQVHPIHVGLDLEILPLRSWSLPEMLQILFVGGDFVRKGGDLLLDVYCRHFANIADLHLVTNAPPSDLPASVFVYTGLRPNDPCLRQLYADAEPFTPPTGADVSSWVAMEAMATGRPVVTTRSGGIPDIVRDGQTGFVIAPNDGTALTDRMRAPLCDPALRCRMGATGRAVVEQDFNAGCLRSTDAFGDCERAADAGRRLASKSAPGAVPKIKEPNAMQRRPATKNACNGSQRQHRTHYGPGMHLQIQ